MNDPGPGRTRPGIQATGPGLGAIVRDRWDVLAVIAAGGGLGSALRWLVATAGPNAPDEVPWATWVVNVTGALVLGALVTVLAELWPPRRYLRPFWGVGVLGGYTTFSTYALEIHLLAQAGRPVLAGAYALGTLLTGIPAAWLGMVLARAALERRGRPGVSDDTRRDR